MKKKFSSILFAFLVPSFLLFSCSEKNKSTTTETIAKEYEVITVTPQDFSINSDFPATIEGEQNIEIRPKIDGYIEKIYVDEGSSVKKGQLLFKISAPQYEQNVRTANANILIAKANVDAARMEVNKIKPLVEKNIISKYELQSAEYNLQSKEAALAQANAALANAKINLGYTMVTSPVSGVVGDIPFKIGSLVGSSNPQPLTTVSNISKIYAYFSVNENIALEFAKDAKGNTTAEKLSSMPAVSLILSNGTKFSQKGKIETAAGMINTGTGSLSLRATFSNPGFLVKSGSRGSVRIPTQLEDALLVPQKSTYDIQGKRFVFIVTDSGNVKSVPIKVRENTGGQYYVVEEGLKSGDIIVYEGVASLHDGEKIVPKKLSADSLFNANKN